MLEEMGVSKDVKRMMRYISDERQNAMGSFCSEAKDREYKEFTDPELALMSIVQPPLTGEDADVFLNYPMNHFLHNSIFHEQHYLYDENYTAFFRIFR